MDAGDGDMWDSGGGREWVDGGYGDMLEMMLCGIHLYVVYGGYGGDGEMAICGAMRCMWDIEIWGRCWICGRWGWLYGGYWVWGSG